MKKILLILLALSSFLLSKEVTVSITPQKYFVQKIAQDKVTVNVMVKPGFSPATYEPKVSQMKKLSSSEAYFSIGVPFESVWLEKFRHANEKMLLVDTSNGIEKIEMEEHVHHEDEEKHEKHEDEKHKHHEHEEHAHHDKEAHEEHAHNEEKHEKHAHHEDEEKHEEHEKHEHGGLDPHIWLDPILVKVQAKNIYSALVKIDIENKEFYRKNYESFLNELDSLDNKLETILKQYEHKAFMVFHPSWGYFAKRYDLEQIAIEVQGKEPKPAQLVELVEEAKKHNIKIVFVSPQFSQNGAKTISKSINGNVAIINPLAEKWDENLIKVAKEIAKTYK
ncbi:metal ABC transporter solute-binding protein, Zn/Mn family [Arcobacter sp. LA11]|uniref:metal ABC transporter solute-binding protein, Zn/Mn family n=1 Tax=Arcobacter sp. LA11 TaxID=1898176 RepID=UPI000934C989|nr:zinc ABC transporter substrate-binding protein [Arcobacter sp. LA11]